MTHPVHVGLVGMGTVGTGVVRVLQDSAEHIARQAGRVGWGGLVQMVLSKILYL